MPFLSSTQSVQELRQQLEAGVYNVVSCPAPRGKATQLADLKVGRYTVYWTPGAGTELDGSDAEPARSWVGLDAARVLRATGPERFERIRLAQLAVTNELEPAPGDAELVRFFGGAAFIAGRDAAGSWEDFGDSTFVLPRVLYVDEPAGARLLVMDLPDLRGGREQTLALALLALETACAAPSASETPPLVTQRADSASAADFERLVRSIQSVIGDGQLDKVVTARRVTLSLSAVPTLSAVLERLGKSAPSCARFALRVAERTFVGASPERLIRRSGLNVLTEALAGTAARTSAADAGERELLRSTKDQDEHTYVVAAIRSALSPVCAELHVAEKPRVKRLSQLLHLSTSIRGTLQSPRHVLTLVNLLHPTPAVGGAPEGAALGWIVSHEVAERGWYSAPFGWMDASGDGEFVVALRSALLSGQDAYLFAGAGIVRDSDPAQEYEETELKLGAMRSALGLKAASGT